MSGGKDKIPVFPSRGNYAIMKIRLKSAVQGHQLLETKVDALEVRFRKSLKTLVRTRMSMGSRLRECYFTIAEVKFHLSPVLLAETVIMGTSNAQLTTKTVTDNVAGVRLPHFQLLDNNQDTFSLLGLARGGMKVKVLKKMFRDLIDNLVTLSTLETTFRQLDEVIKTTKRRVHALENVLIPKFENTVAYIIAELDEMEREDFYRIKMLQKKKRAAKQKAEEARKNKEKGAGDSQGGAGLPGRSRGLRKCELRELAKQTGLIPCLGGLHQASPNVLQVLTPDPEGKESHEEKPESGQEQGHGEGHETGQQQGQEQGPEQGQEKDLKQENK